MSPWLPHPPILSTSKSVAASLCPARRTLRPKVVRPRKCSAPTACLIRSSPAPGREFTPTIDPPIREAALVIINGQPAGALWHPPYRLDVTKFLKSGMNHVEIHVFNTALNAWSALPPHDYGPLIAKYGDRFQMQDLNQVMPISSGLLGDVRFVNEIK